MNKMQAGPGRLVGSLVVTLFHIYMHIQISYRQLGSLGSRRLDKAFFSSENTNRSEGARVSNMCCSHRAAAGLSGRSWLCAEGSEDLFGLLQAFCMGMSVCSLHSSMSFVVIQFLQRRSSSSWPPSSCFVDYKTEFAQLQCVENKSMKNAERETNGKIR